MGDCLIFQAKACSRPPEPIRRIFITALKKCTQFTDQMPKTGILTDAIPRRSPAIKILELLKYFSLRKTLLKFSAISYNSLNASKIGIKGHNSLDRKDFHSEKAGNLIRTLEGYLAFIPAPPPPEIHYDPALALLLSQADAALSELSGLGLYLPNPELLIAPYVKREAVASSRIEGTQAGLSDLLFDELAPKQTPAGSDVLEVRNYVSALDLGLRKLEELPLAGRLIREMHAVLLRGVRDDSLAPGEFRKSQNWIGPPGCTLENATYIPPPHHPEMHECLKHWEVFVNQRGRMPELVQCALIHEHFEAIHPFLDGNGRIGRLLITLFLIERGRLSKPLLYLSTYIERNKQEYYDLLQRIRTDGDWTAWLRFFLVAVRDTAQDAISQSHSLLRLRETFRKKLKAWPRSLILLDELFINPYTTIARAAELMGVTAPTATKAVAHLEKAGMLREVSGRGWGRYWVARPILDAVETPPPIPAHHPT